MNLHMPEIKTKTFEEAYRRLNKEQREAVDTVDGPVMVVAGPGTGKTEVLAVRIANIILKTGTPPEAILALTFTESGVHSMKLRLRELIGPDAYRVTVATFHGFANSIIQDYPEYFPDIVGSSPIDEAEQIKVLRKILDETPFEHLKTKNNPYYYLEKIKRAIEDLKREGVLPGDFRRIAEQEEKEFASQDDVRNAAGKVKTKYLDDERHIEKNKELAAIYEAYERELRSGSHYDYNDMIMEVAEALEKRENLRATLQEKYHYFLIDEHQDTNKAQNKILELLASFYDNPNLFIVGDAKQAIFRFQGASIENFFHFRKLYRDVRLVNLKDNYRSTQIILDAAYALAKRDEPLKARAGHVESPIKICAFDTRDEENYFIARKANELIANGERPEEIAVIFRENKDAESVARMLENLGILSNIESEDDVMSDPDFERFKVVLEAVQNFGDDALFLKALSVGFFDIPPLDIYKLSVAAAAMRRETERGHAALDIARSKALLEKAGIERSDLFLDFERKLSFWKSASEKEGVLNVFSDIVRESGFLAKILRDREGAIKLERLHALFNHLRTLAEAHREYRLADFMEYLRLLEEHNVRIKSPSAGPIPGRVRLMTAHRSKGLEFNEVFIVNAIEGKWGSQRKRPEHIKLPARVFSFDQAGENGESEKTDEELNIFYVALTRAKKEVYLTHASLKDSGEPTEPTRFIDEIAPELTERIDTKRYKEEFASHLEVEFAKRPHATPPLMEKEYLNRLFREQSFSVTALNNFLTCPWQYFYRNLVRIPESPTPSLAFGNAVHYAMKNFFEALKGGKKPDKEYFLKMFRFGLAHEPLMKTDEERLLLRGERSLAGYYDEYEGTWDSNVLVEYPINDVEQDGIKLTGKLDKMELLDIGGRVNVVDYKTGKPKSENEVKGLTKSSDGNYFRQLSFYKLLLDNHKSERFTMASGIIDFVEPTESGAYRRYAFELSDGDVKKVSEEIKDAAQKILDLSFWNDFCGDKDCPYCKLRKMSLS